MNKIIIIILITLVWASTLPKNLKFLIEKTNYCKVDADCAYGSFHFVDKEKGFYLNKSSKKLLEAVVKFSSFVHFLEYRSVRSRMKVFLTKCENNQCVLGDCEKNKQYNYMNVRCNCPEGTKNIEESDGLHFECVDVFEKEGI